MRDVQSLTEELRALEAELRTVQGAQNTKERTLEITKFVTEQQSYDALVTKTPSNPYVGSSKPPTTCC